MTEQEMEKEISRLKERERSLMRQLDLARATIAFQAYGILAPKENLPLTASQLMTLAGYTRRPPLPKDEE